MCVSRARSCWSIGLALTIAGVALLPELGGGILIVLAVFVGLSGVQLLALSVVGEYVWSALAEARRRPQYVIEASTSDDLAMVLPDGQRRNA